MRFGLFIPQGWRLDLVGIDPADQWPVMRDLALRADKGPWESIWVYDHFHTVPEPTDEATHEAWTLVSAFGAVTSRVRLGQMCTAMSYRNPAYLAKVAATAVCAASTKASRSSGRPGPRARQRSTASTTKSTERLCVRCPSRKVGSRSGSPAAGKR